MQLKIIHNDFSLEVCFFFPINLVISGFPKGAGLTFLCGRRSQLSLQYGVLEFSAFSTETSAAQINSVCLVSIVFTFYPSSYASFMLGTLLPTVSSGNRGKENTGKVYYVPGW